MPSAVIGILTTTCGSRAARTLPSAIMPSASSARTSAEIGPSTMEAISLMVAWKSLPSLHQRRICGDAGNKSHIIGFADGFHISGIDKNSADSPSASACAQAISIHFLMLPTYYYFGRKSRKTAAKAAALRGGLARGRLAHGWRMKALLE